MFFDNPFLTHDENSHSRALHRWERIKKSINLADNQIKEWQNYKKELQVELHKHKEEAREIFKELMDDMGDE